ncbi:MAG TPA: NB-ARC domain-containing protein [Ktedonobacterales bacterium]
MTLGGHDEAFGSLLRRLRKAQGLRQRELAERARLGVRTISDLERGINHPHRDTLKQLIHALKLKGADRATFEAAARHRDGDAPSATPREDVAVVRRKSAATSLPDPLAADAIIGRDAFLNDCLARLKEQRIVALYGLPGVGKSTLAVKLAHLARGLLGQRYRILFAALGPEPDINSVLGSWGARLHLASADAANAVDTEGWARAIHDAIGQQRILLVIDDVWSIEHFVSLKVGGPNCLYLVTTRAPSIAAEIASSAAIHVEELSPADGCALLARLAPLAVTAEPQSAAELVQAVGALPLALTVMGNHLRIESMSGQPRRIQAALAALADPKERFRLERQLGPVERSLAPGLESRNTLYAVIDLSVRHMLHTQRAGQDAAQTLYRLSIFPPKPSDFSEDAAQDICESSDAALDLLWDRGLLESTGKGRYTLHQMIHSYARMHLSRREAVVVHERMLDYYTTLVEQRATNYDLLSRENSNMLSALRVASQRPSAAFVRGITAFAPFLELRGEFEVSERLLELAEEAALALADAVGTARARLHSGRLDELRGHYQRALSLYEAGLEALSSEDDPQLRIILLARCADVALRCGNSADAERLARDGLALAHESNEGHHIGLLLRIIAQAAGNRGELVVGDQYYAQALDFAEANGDVETVITCLQHMGIIAFKRGFHEAAIDFLTNGLERSRQVGHVRRIAALQNALGCVYVHYAERQDADQREQWRLEAERLLTSCLHLATQRDLPQWMNNALQNLGALERYRKRYDRSDAFLQRALSIAKEMGDRWLIGETLCEVGQLYEEMGEADRALFAYKQALTVATEGEDIELELVAIANYGIGRTWARSGRFDLARDYGQKSLRDFTTLMFGQTSEVQAWLDRLPHQRDD